MKQKILFPIAKFKKTNGLISDYKRCTYTAQNVERKTPSVKIIALNVEAYLENLINTKVETE